MMSLTPILIHDEGVPASARKALRAATAAAAPDRAALLVSAAKILYAETNLECEEARELVGLPDTDEGCGCD